MWARWATVDCCKTSVLGGVVASAVDEMAEIVALSKLEKYWPVKTSQ
jgi:hypothetical protein